MISRLFCLSQLISFFLFFSSPADTYHVVWNADCIDDDDDRVVFYSFVDDIWLVVHNDLIMNQVEFEMNRH